MKKLEAWNELQGQVSLANFNFAWREYVKLQKQGTEPVTDYDLLLFLRRVAETR